MSFKVTHCARHVSANTRPHQPCWGDWEMGTAISCIEYSLVAGFIQKLVERDSLKAPSLHTAVLYNSAFVRPIVSVYYNIKPQQV